MGKSSKIRHRRRRTISWRRIQAERAVLRDFERKGASAESVVRTKNFQHLVAARMKG